MFTDNKRKYKPLETVETRKTSQPYDEKTFDIHCKVLLIYSWKKSEGVDFVMTLDVVDSFNRRMLLKIFNPKCLMFNFEVNDNLFVRNVKWYKDNLFCVQQPIQIDVINKKNDFRRDNSKLCEIKDIGTKKYIDIAGLIIYKKKETNNIVIVDLIDFTKNPKINGNLNRGTYTYDMILRVKLWDTHSNLYDEISIGSFYKIENLKVNIQDNLISGDLSDQKNSKIYILQDTNIINKINRRKKEYEKPLSIFYKDISLKMKDVDKEGFFRSEFVVLRHFPPDGETIETCRKCEIIITSKKNNCICPISFKDKTSILKLLVRDESGDVVILCKNDICNQALKRLKKNEKSWKCLVYAKRVDDNLVLEIREFLSN